MKVQHVDFFLLLLNGRYSETSKVAGTQRELPESEASSPIPDDTDFRTKQLRKHLSRFYTHGAGGVNPEIDHYSRFALECKQNEGAARLELFILIVPWLPEIETSAIPIQIAVQSCCEPGKLPQFATTKRALTTAGPQRYIAPIKLATLELKFT